MNTLLMKIEDSLTDAALSEMGVDVFSSIGRSLPEHESLEENLIEVAFAEAADYDDIHKAILRERQRVFDVVHPDECQYDDNDICFV